MSLFLLFQRVRIRLFVSITLSKMFKTAVLLSLLATSVARVRCSYRLSFFYNANFIFIIHIRSSLTIYYLPLGPWLAWAWWSYLYWVREGAWFDYASRNFRVEESWGTLLHLLLFFVLHSPTGALTLQFRRPSPPNLRVSRTTTLRDLAGRCV